MDATKPALRMTTRHLIVAVGVSAIVLASVFAADSGFFWMLFAAYLLTLPTGLRRHTLRWLPSVVALAVLAYAVNTYDSVAVCMVGFYGLLLCFLSLPSLPRRSDGGRDRRFAALWVACLVVVGLIPFVNWPPRLSFVVIRPQLEAVAKSLEAGVTPPVPRVVGHHVIRGVELRDGRPCLWTDTNRNGFTGFVRNPFLGVNRAAGRYSNLHFNLWSGVTLDREWAFISED